MHTKPPAADVASAGRVEPARLARELARLRVDVDSDGEPVGPAADVFEEGGHRDQLFPKL